MTQVVAVIGDSHPLDRGEEAEEVPDADPLLPEVPEAVEAAAVRPPSRLRRIIRAVVPFAMAGAALGHRRLAR